MRYISLLLGGATDTGDTPILSYILGAIIVIAAFVLVYRHLKTKQGREGLERFLQEVESVVRIEILDTLSKMDLSTIVAANLQEAEIELLNSLYKRLWDLLERHLDEMYGKDPYYKFMKANLTPEFVQGFSERIINSEAVQKLIADKEEAAMTPDEADELEEKYTKMNEEIENGTFENDEEPIPDIPIEQAMPDSNQIIPPSEDGAGFDKNIDEVVGEAADIEEVSTVIVADDDDELPGLIPGA